MTFFLARRFGGEVKTAIGEGGEGVQQATKAALATRRRGRFTAEGEGKLISI